MHTEQEKLAAAFKAMAKEGWPVEYYNGEPLLLSEGNLGVACFKAGYDFATPPAASGGGEPGLSTLLTEAITHLQKAAKWPNSENELSAGIENALPLLEALATSLAESATSTSIGEVAGDDLIHEVLDAGDVHDAMRRAYKAVLPSEVYNALLGIDRALSAHNDKLRQLLTTRSIPVGEAAKQQTEAWEKCSEKMPEKIGHYLCLCDDGTQLICFVNVLGQWSVFPGAQYYGDLAAAGAPQPDREVQYWRTLPAAPQP